MVFIMCVCNFRWFIIVAAAFGYSGESPTSLRKKSGYIVSHRNYPEEYKRYIWSRVLFTAMEDNSINFITLVFLNYHLTTSSTYLQLTNVTAESSTTTGNVKFQQGVLGILPTLNTEYRYARPSNRRFELIFHKPYGYYDNFMLWYHGEYASLFLNAIMSIFIAQPKDDQITHYNEAAALW